MKKIKIIDLLNMRARNEEMPRKIKYDATEFQYDGEYGMYYDENFDSLEDIILLFKRLNDEVEIIEEDKTNKIEKIDVTIKYLSNNLNDCVLEDISDIQIKLNEVIDAVNKLNKDN